MGTPGQEQAGTTQQSETGLSATLDALLSPATESERERRRILALCAPFGLLVLVAGAYPLWEAVRMSVSVEPYESVGFTLDAYAELFGDPYYRGVALNSLWFATATTLASVGIAVPIAHALEKYDLPGEGLWVTLVSFPISLPGIVAAFMILVWFGNTGVLTNLLAAVAGQEPRRVAIATSVPGLFLAFLYSMIPRSTLILRGTYAELDHAAEEAAQALGATPWQTFRYVTLPQIRPGIIGAFILTFRTALAIFGTLIVISALLVWTLQIDRELAGGAFPLAGAMAVVFFAFTFLFTVLGLRYTSAEVGL